MGDVVICDGDMQAMLSLSDGSILSMDPESSLQLVSSQPQVAVARGEVLFEIAEHQPGHRPFEVRTQQSTVDVMGTMFTLNAADQTQLKVYEGSVKFTRSSDNSSVQVEPEQMASTGESTFEVRSLSPPTEGNPAAVSC